MHDKSSNKRKHAKHEVRTAKFSPSQSPQLASPLAPMPRLFRQRAHQLVVADVQSSPEVVFFTALHVARITECENEHAVERLHQCQVICHGPNAQPLVRRWILHLTENDQAQEHVNLIHRIAHCSTHTRLVPIRDFFLPPRTRASMEQLFAAFASQLFPDTDPVGVITVAKIASVIKHFEPLSILF